MREHAGELYVPDMQPVNKRIGKDTYANILTITYKHTGHDIKKHSTHTHTHIYIYDVCKMYEIHFGSCDDK